jgi:hypothetical protein
LRADQILNQVQAGNGPSTLLASQRLFHAFANDYRFRHAATPGFFSDIALECFWQFERHCRHVLAVIPIAAIGNTG